MAPCRMMRHAAHLLLSVVKRLMAMVCTGVPRLPAMVTGPQQRPQQHALARGCRHDKPAARDSADFRNVLYSLQSSILRCSNPVCGPLEQVMHRQKHQGVPAVLELNAALSVRCRYGLCCAPSSSADDVAHDEAAPHSCATLTASARTGNTDTKLCRHGRSGKACKQMNVYLTSQLQC